MIEMDAPKVASPLQDPPPLAARQRGWQWWLGMGISLALLVIILLQVRNVDLDLVARLVPENGAFWIVFFAAYFTGPASDWVIFRRLWRIPASGFLALVRKLIGNELLFGYAGELYLYTWARRNTQMTSAPFGAIKDVAILSAMTANGVALLLLVVAWPLLTTLRLGFDMQSMLLSVGVVILLSSVILLFRKMIFSLPRADLWFITAVHLLRVVINNALLAVCWYLALPGVGLSLLLVLATLRLLLTRLPLVPNKDIAFAALAIFLVGRDDEIGALMTMMASVTLVAHLGLGLLLLISEAVEWKR
jgi:hypothetical protein